MIDNRNTNYQQANFQQSGNCSMVLLILFCLDDNRGSCMEDYHSVNMDVNVVPSLTTMFGTTSDLVIAFMTINRYHLIKSMYSGDPNYGLVRVRYSNGGPQLGIQMVFD